MKISVVIASAAGGEFLHKCLDSLYCQANTECEIIVVDRCGGEVVSGLEEKYPFVQLIITDLDQRHSVPELRAFGAAQAMGEVVAIIEEHCIASQDWIKSITENFHGNDIAIGGPILDDNYQRLIDWAVYFSEYHNYLPPWGEGNRYLLNGANIAYRRENLLKYKDNLSSGYWEVVLHPMLVRDGDFRAVPQMGVHHTGPFNFRYYLTQRYLLSRVWGGTQRNKVNLGKRIQYLFLGPLVPFLLLFRIVLRVLQSGQRTEKLLLTMPLLLPIVITYAWGEWLGYLVGMGDALERVE